MKLRYFGNTYDPRQPDVLYSIVVGWDESPQEAYQRHADWLRDKMIGDPQPTSTYTVEQLKKMNMVGVYSRTIDEYAQANPECVVEYDGWLDVPVC